MGLFNLPKLQFMKRDEEDGKLSFKDFAVRVGYNRPEEFQMIIHHFIREHMEPRLYLATRGIGKTVQGTILTTAYLLYLNPNYTVGIITKEGKRVQEIVRAIADCLMAVDVPLASFNGTTINLKQKRLSINQSNVKGVTLGGRGLRGLHPDLIIMDDPVTEVDAWSEAERRLVKSKWDEINKLNTNICVIGQPVSNKDLYSVLRGKILTYEQTWNDIPNQFFGTIYKPDLDKMRLTVSERSIQMSYFLNVPDDPSLAFAKIETVDYCCPENVMFIDPSAGKGDYTAVSIGGIFMRTNKFVTCGFMFNEAWFDIMDVLPELLQRFNVRKLLVEQNGVGAGMPEMLRKNGINCVAVTTTQNKHQKIISVADQVPYMALTQLKASDGFGGRLLEANQLFIENVKEYTYDAKHDDGIDSMVSLIKEGFGIRNEQ